VVENIRDPLLYRSTELTEEAALHEELTALFAQCGADVTPKTFHTLAYRTVVFHLAVIQALCSGTVAGQLGEGSAPDGVKHAAALFGATYVAFLFV
jgi:hypothetical protein